MTLVAPESEKGKAVVDEEALTEDGKSVKASMVVAVTVSLLSEGAFVVVGGEAVGMTHVPSTLQ